MIGFVLIAMGIIGLILLFFVGISFLGAWLWNITMPYIFHLPHVEWWHILALIVLLWILLPSSVRRVRLWKSDDE